MRLFFFVQIIKINNDYNNNSNQKIKVDVFVNQIGNLSSTWDSESINRNNTMNRVTLIIICQIGCNIP